MHWLVFAGTSVLFFSVASLFQRITMKDSSSDPVVSAALFQFIMAGGTAVVSIVLGFSVPGLNESALILVAAILYATGTLLLFRAIQTLEASQMTILTTFGTVVALIVSFIVLGDRLSTAQIAGALLILLSTVIINLRGSGLRFTPGAWLALAGSACYGSAVVIDGLVLRTVGTFTYLPLTNALSGMVILLANPSRIPHLVRSLRSIRPSLIIYSLLYMFAAILFYLPIENGTSVSLMAASNRASILLTVLLSMIFLGERDTIGRKLLAAAVTTAGIILIR